MQKVLPKLTPITPHELYLQRVNAMYDFMRKTQRGYKYTPAQFGGLFGQRVVANGSEVLEMTTFEVK